MTAPSPAPGWIAVIVVNYGTADLAISAVESVLARTHGGRKVHVHVVDNASPGDDAAVLARRFPAENWGDRVTLHLEPTNHGFGRGNNVVLHQLAERDDPPAHVMLLNPDARLHNEAIDILAQHLDTHPRVGAVGSGIAHPDGTAATAAFRFPTLAGQFERAANFGPLSRLLRGYRIPLTPDHPAGPVDWVAGAGVMLRFDAIRAVGFFDPAYFLYFEEVDLMRQLGRAGWTVWYLPQAQVIHVEGAATGVASSSGRKRRPSYVYDSWRHYYRKNYGRAGATAITLAAMAGAVLNLTVCRLRGQTPWLPMHYLRDMTMLVLWPLLTGSRAPATGLAGPPASGR